MGTKRRILLPQINGIGASSAAGAVGTLDLPLGYRYHRLDIVYIETGASPGELGAYAGTNNILGDVVLYRNGIAERTHTAAELDYLNLINGSQYAKQSIAVGTSTATITRQTLPIFFAEPWRKDKSDTDYMAWNVDASSGFNTFQLKLTIAYAVPSGGAFQVWAVVDSPIAPPSGSQWNVKKVYRQSLPTGGAFNDVNTLDARDAYQSICLKNPASAYIGKVSFKYNDVTVHEQVNRLDNIAALVGQGMNISVSNTPITADKFGFPLIFDFDDPINSALPATGARLWLKMEYADPTTGASATATGSVVALIERLGPLD